jgi:outer membrane protein OmpA-like peptidoglycan-associated protein
MLKGEDEMKTVISLLIASGINFVGAAAFAQSVITLDSFELNENSPLAAEPINASSSKPQSCLVNPDQASCALDGGTSSRTFTLSDVVNLGIIDRSEVEVEDAQGAIVRVEEKVEPLPSIDLEILFDYDSAELRPDQVAPLVALAQDLRGIDFSKAQLVLMGHTDGVGSATYNRALSYRRAASVADFISQAANIPLYRIRSSGMGFDYLRFPQDPAHPANRRVQILLVE